VQASQRGLSMERQNEGPKKKTKALLHSLLMGGSNSFKIVTQNKGLPPIKTKQNTQKDATFKVNVKELEIATDGPSSELSYKGAKYMDISFASPQKTKYSNI